MTDDINQWFVFITFFTTDLRLFGLSYFVENDHGEMLPYSAFMTMKKIQFTHYNLYNSVAIFRLPAECYATAYAIQVINEVGAQTLPHGYVLITGGSFRIFPFIKSNKSAQVELIIIIGLLGKKCDAYCEVCSKNTSGRRFYFGSGY